MHTEEQIDTLNSLLRGEISAVETYQQAMGRIGADPRAAELSRIHDEHREAANELRTHIRGHNGTPDHGSGAWGAFARAVAGVAKLLGNTAALKALKEGEEQGVKSYEHALEDKDLPEECKDLIRNVLLPQTWSHIAVLDQLMRAR